MSPLTARPANKKKPTICDGHHTSPAADCAKLVQTGGQVLWRTCHGCPVRGLNRRNVTTSGRGPNFSRIVCDSPNSEHRGLRVMLLSNPACKRCSRTMQEVADIAPHGAEPGLRAFICNDCGATDSVLIYSGGPFGMQAGRYGRGGRGSETTRMSRSAIYV